MHIARWLGIGVLGIGLVWLGVGERVSGADNKKHSLSSPSSYQEQQPSEKPPQEKGLTKKEVASWIYAQSTTQSLTSDNEEFLSFAEINLDQDEEPEIYAYTDNGVHLGDFYVFDRKADGKYKLVTEQPWHVDNWSAKPLYYTDQSERVFEVVTRTGGSGMDVYESHLVYLTAGGEWKEAWTATLKERSSFQNTTYLKLGGYGLNEETGQLLYWQTEQKTDEESGAELMSPVTTTERFQWENGIFKKN